MTHKHKYSIPSADDQNDARCIGCGQLKPPTYTAKHTPGPWAVEPRQWDHGASLAIVAPQNGYIVAVVPFDEDIQTVDEPDYETVKRHPDDIPNSNLIAAAPAMYEALQKLVTYLREEVPDEALGTWAPVFKAAMALAQAEGRQG